VSLVSICKEVAHLILCLFIIILNRRQQVSLPTAAPAACAPYDIYTPRSSCLREVTAPMLLCVCVTLDMCHELQYV
jgi:hypothetical protein